MDKNVKVWLYDILNAIIKIESYFDGSPEDSIRFTEDLRTTRAVERNLEIIGEALNRILKQSGEIKISNSRKIIGTRNKIIHAYESVSNEVIWSIVNTHLPILRAEIQFLLEE